MASKIKPDLVKHVADLAMIPTSPAMLAKLTAAFDETLDVISNLQGLNTDSVEPTHQVTGLENVWREDTVDESNMFTQTQALANAKKTYQGYFVVPQIIDQE